MPQKAIDNENVPQKATLPKATENQPFSWALSFAAFALNFGTRGSLYQAPTTVPFDKICNLILTMIIKFDKEKIILEIVRICKDKLNYQGYPVNFDKVLVLRNTKHHSNRLKIDEIINYLKAYKQQLISDISYELESEKVVSDLTKVYFETEVAKGNVEMVIVKLCVRLEAVLHSTYHYEGDFSEMLNKYCNAYGQEDDGWGYNQEAKFVKYLQKLRKCRNGIVHSEKTQEKLSLDEIRYCIDYICNMK